MEPEVAGALVGGGFALGGVAISHFSQMIHSNRHRFTIYRQEKYAEFYTLSNECVAHLQQVLMWRRAAIPPAAHSARSWRGTEANALEQRAERARSASEAAEAASQEFGNKALRMILLQSTFAMMSPRKLRDGARAVVDGLTGLLSAATRDPLPDPEEWEKLTSANSHNQVRFVNLARKDLGVTPWWVSGPSKE